MLSPGQDAIISFDGDEYVGEIIDVDHGWVLARILIDPVNDHDNVPLAPVSQVMVRERDVRLPE